MNSIHYRIAELNDLESLYKFELSQRFGADQDNIENQMQVWSASYRKESLEHYLKLGWSFLALNNNSEIEGYFLGQPLLFFDQQTQTLWIEYMRAINLEIATELINIGYRLAREKHFQRVLVSEDIRQLKFTQDFPFTEWNRKTFLLKTTK